MSQSESSNADHGVSRRAVLASGLGLAAAASVGGSAQAAAKPAAKAHGDHFTTRDGTRLFYKD